LGVHPTQLRNWVKALADDPQHAFPEQGQMKPEQLEIARLKRLSKDRERSSRWQRAAELLLAEAGVAAFSKQVELALFYDAKLDLAK
jgi:transposase-like protein